MANKFPTLKGLQEAIKAAQALGDKELVRKAKENLRIFKYHQQGSLTAKGRLVRH